MSAVQSSDEVREALVAAFPMALERDVRAGVALMPSVRYPPVGWFTVVVGDVSVRIPSRLYNPEPQLPVESRLTALQSTVLGCLYSRHHDGFVRQRRLEQVIGVSEPWVAPFVVRLAGEYVLEILLAIQRGLPDLLTAGSAQRHLYGRFLRANPEFFARTERRIVSYWSCYWRSVYPKFGSYPGGQLLEVLRSAAESEGGGALPTYAPSGRHR